MIRLEGWRSVREDVGIDNEDYFVSLEEFRNIEDPSKQMVFIHLTVKTKFSKELLKRFKHEFTLLRKHTAGVPIFALAADDDDKWSSFVKLFGFKLLSSANCTDGKTRRIFWHQGNDQLTTKNTIGVDQRALGSPSPVHNRSV